MREQKGITLVALIITIIVMLILVGVTVSVVIESNLFDTASKAGEKYNTAWQSDRKQDDKVNIVIDGKEEQVDISTKYNLDT